MSIQRRPDGKWRARHRGPDGKERARHFARKVDAERWLAAQTVAKDRGEWVDPALARVTVGVWAATWLASKDGLKPTARRSYNGAWRTLVQPRWEDVPLVRVSYGDVVTWVAELTGRGLSPSRVRLALLTLKQIMDLAVLDGRLARNVAAPVKAPRARRGEQRFLTHAQLGALADECGPYRTLVLVLGYTGIRWGEARALRVKHVDLLLARLDIAENIPDGCDEAQTVAPKSHKRRVVPIPRFVADELAPVVAGRRLDELVFPNTAGGLLDNSNFRRHIFDPAARALGLAPLTRTTSATPPPASRSAPGPTSRPCSACSGTPPPR
ncbi:MAG: tyrosine-type recombinase/integrase [Mycobacterium leprae]